MSRKKTHLLEAELNKIKNNILDSYLKLQLSKKRDECIIELIDYNRKAKKKLNINEADNFDVIKILCQELSPDHNWKTELINACIQQKESCFETENKLNGKNFHIRISPIEENICILNIKETTHSVKNKRELYETKQLYKDFANQIPEIICDVNMDGKIIFANQTALTTFGYTEDDIKTKLDTYDFFQEKDHDIIRSNFQKILNGEKLPSNEYRLNAKGKSIHIILSTTPIRNNKEIVGIRAIMADITKKDEIHKQLASRETNFRNLFDSMRTLIFIINKDGSILHTNQQARTILKYNKAEFNNLNITELHPEKHRNKCKEIISEANILKKNIYNIPLLDKNGNEIAVESSIMTGIWNNMEVFFVNSNDLSEIKASEKKFEAAFKTNPSLMAITTPDGYVIDVNDAFLKITEYNKSELLHRGIRDLKLVENKAILEPIKENILSQGSIKNLHLQLRTKTGKKLKCLFSAEIIKQMNTHFILIVINDITEEQKLNSRLNLAMKTARLAWYEYDLTNGMVTSDKNKSEMLGYNSSEMNYQNFNKWLQLIHPDDREPAIEEITKCKNGEQEMYEIDYRMKKENGEYIWFFNRGIVMDYDKNGKPIKITGIIVDVSERKENEEKYRTLIENANDVILITQNGIIKYANDKVKDFFGYSKEDIIEKSFFQHVSQGERQKIINYHKLRSQGQNISPIYETKVKNKDGKDVPVELNNSFFTFNNEPAILTFVRDLRERKKTAKQLKQMLLEFEYAANNIRSIIWKSEVTKEGNLENTYISIVADRLLGYPEGTINNDLDKYFSHIHPDDIKSAMDRLKYIIKNPGEKTELEYRVIKADGEIAWFMTQGSSEIDEEGKHFTFGVTMDLSDRKLAEENINNQKEFLRSLLDTIPSMIGVKNREGKYITVNKQFAEFYDLTPEFILEKKDEDFIIPELAKELNSNDTSILESGTPVYYDSDITHKNQKQYFEISKVPLKNHKNEFDKLLIVSNSITEQTLAKREIQRKSQELLLLTEHIDVQIWYLKDPYTYGIVNKAHATFIGKTKTEVEHQNIIQLFNKETANRYIKTNLECFELKSSIMFDEWNLDENGNKRLLRITKTPMIKPNGEVDLVICLARDITEEQKAESELKSNLNFTKSLIQNSPLGILVYQTDGQCILANQAATVVTGAKNIEELLKQNIHSISSWYKSGLFDMFKQSITHNRTIHRNVPIQTTFGKDMWMECHFSQIEYKHKKHIILIIDDITEVKNQEISIQNNLERQKTLSQIAFQLSELKDFNFNIHKTLDIIGNFMNVSRIFIFRNTEDGTHCYNEYEWCNEGIASQQESMKNLPYSSIPGWKEMLKNQKCISTDDIKTLPTKVYNILYNQGVKATIAYPLSIFNEDAGFIGFDEYSHNRKWTPDETEFLYTISHLLTNAYERKLIGDNLKDSEEKFKKITSGAMDGIILINSQGKVNYWNPAAENIFGYSRFEIMGKGLHQLLTRNKDQESYLKNKELFAKTGNGNAIGNKLELKAFHKSGKLIDVELSLTSLKIKGEWNALGIVRDITERIKADDKLKTLSKAVENASASIVITDTEGNIEYVNKKFVEITDYTSEEVIGKNPRILSSGKHPKEFYTELWETITKGKEWKGEFHNKRKNGDTYYESALISSVTDDNDNIKHYIGIKQDITKEKRAQTELIEAKRNAEMANKAKSEFLANMSHEIRTPMNAVIGFSDILTQKITNQEHLSYLGSIQASSKTLLNLINDILDLSKIEAGQLKLQNEVVDLNLLIGDISQIFALKIQQKDLSLEIHIDENIPQKVFLDELRIRQILLNLIGNAVKFTENGYIKISATKTKSHLNGNIDIKIDIEDTGIGIKENSQNEIFEAFKQQENHDTKKYGGTGLGLSITKRLVEMQGGKIELKSKEGYGSTFSVVFENIKIPDEIQTFDIPEDNENKQEYQFKNELILIVDDVPSNRFLINSYLSDLNIRTIEAVNGAEAVELCLAELPAIVFMDLRMPVMNGIDATKMIKQNSKTKDIPVIAVTASSMHFEDKDIEESGFDGFLDKPVSQEEIIEELIRHIKPENRAKTVLTKQLSQAKFTELDLNTEQTELLKDKMREQIIEAEHSGNMSTISQLSEELKELAQNNQIPQLEIIANELHTSSQNFDIEHIQLLFNELLKHC